MASFLNWKLINNIFKVIVPQKCCWSNKKKSSVKLKLPILEVAENISGKDITEINHFVKGGNLRYVLIKKINLVLNSKYVLFQSVT